MSRPNIIQIIVNQQHWKAWGYAGNPLVSTPYLDSIAKHGLYFDQASAHAVAEASAAKSLFTGRFPQQKGDDASLPFVPELLQQASYTTAYIGARAGLIRESGFDQIRLVGEPGQDSEDDDYCAWLREREAPACALEAHHSPQDGPAPMSQEWTETTWIATQAVRFLKATTEPFYATLHFTSPGPVFNPPQPWASQYKATNMHALPGLNGSVDFDKNAQKRLAWYYGLVSHLDSQIGRVMGMLSVQGHTNTVIVFTANQGHAFGAPHNDNPIPALAIHEAEMRVPLVISGVFGQRRGERSHALVQHSDIAPALLNLAGADDTFPHDGVNLLPHLRGEKSTVHRGAYSQTRDHLSVIRNKDYTLQLSPDGLYRHDTLSGVCADNLLGAPKHIKAQVQLFKAWEKRVSPPK